MGSSVLFDMFTCIFMRSESIVRRKLSLKVLCQTSRGNKTKSTLLLLHLMKTVCSSWFITFQRLLSSPVGVGVNLHKLSFSAAKTKNKIMGLIYIFVVKENS